jgi:hypothetical protein
MDKDDMDEMDFLRDELDFAKADLAAAKVEIERLHKRVRLEDYEEAVNQMNRFKSERDSLQCQLTAAQDALRDTIADAAANKSERDEAIELLKDTCLWISHSRVFITSRQKMNPTGIDLIDEAYKKTCAFLARMEVKP